MGPCRLPCCNSPYEARELRLAEHLELGSLLEGPGEVASRLVLGFRV